MGVEQYSREKNGTKILYTVISKQKFFLHISTTEIYLDRNHISRNLPQGILFRNSAVTNFDNNSSESNVQLYR